MDVETQRFNDALLRLTSEAARAENEWMALVTLERAGVYGRIDFLTVCYEALFNSIISRLTRIYDRHRDAASLWYLVRLAPDAIRPSFAEAGLPDLEEVSERLAVVRDKIQSHFDKQYVGNLKGAWEASGLNGEKFYPLVHDTARALRDAHRKRLGSDFPGAVYGAADLTVLLTALGASGGPR